MVSEKKAMMKRISSQLHARDDTREDEWLEQVGDDLLDLLEAQNSIDASENRLQHIRRPLLPGRIKPETEALKDAIKNTIAGQHLSDDLSRKRSSALVADSMGSAKTHPEQ